MRLDQRQTRLAERGFGSPLQRPSTTPLCEHEHFVFRHSSDRLSVHFKRREIGIQSAVTFAANCPEIILRAGVTMVRRPVVIHHKDHPMSPDCSPTHLAAPPGTAEHLSSSCYGDARIRRFRSSSGYRHCKNSMFYSRTLCRFVKGTLPMCPKVPKERTSRGGELRRRVAWPARHSTKTICRERLLALVFSLIGQQSRRLKTTCVEYLTLS